MKTLGMLAFAAGLILAGAASAHPHFMPSNQGGMGGGQTVDGKGSDNGKTGDGLRIGFDNIKGESKAGVIDTKMGHHDWRKDDHRERIVHRLEERRERLKMEIAKLVFELTHGLGKPELIKLEVVRLEQEIVKVNTKLLKGESAA